jgi:glutamine synthetase
MDAELESALGHGATVERAAPENQPDDGRVQFQVNCAQDFHDLVAEDVESLAQSGIEIDGEHREVTVARHADGSPVSELGAHFVLFVEE